MNLSPHTDGYDRLPHPSHCRLSVPGMPQLPHETMPSPGHDLQAWKLFMVAVSHLDNGPGMLLFLLGIHPKSHKQKGA